MCAVALSGAVAARYYACSDPSTHAPTPMPRAALTVCRQLCAALLLLLPSLQGLARERVALAPGWDHELRFAGHHAARVETPLDTGSPLLPASEAGPGGGSGAHASARVTWLVVVAVCVIGLILAALYWWDRRPRVAAAVLMLLVVGAAGLLEWRFREQRANEQRLELLERLGSLRSRLESVIAKNLALTNGLAAFVAANPDLGQDEFAAYARNVLVREPSLRNLAAAPGLVVRYVYPHKGNEAVLGLDYRANPAQREAGRTVRRPDRRAAARGGVRCPSRAPYTWEPAPPNRTR